MVQLNLRSVLRVAYISREENLYTSYFQRLGLLEKEPELILELEIMLRQGAVSDV